MNFFRKITSETDKQGRQNVVLMGRKTWESIPQKHRPLKDRINVVISTTMSSVPESVRLVRGFDEAVSLLQSKEFTSLVDQVYVIGGSTVYNRAMESQYCHRIYLTRVLKDITCDTFMPQIDENRFRLIKCPEIDDNIQTEKDYQYKFEVYEKRMAQGRQFNVCAAMLPDRGIGKNRTISWPPIRMDFEHYMALTAQSKDPKKKCVNIKGRITLEESSELELSRSNVINIVISKTLQSCPDYVHRVVPDWESAMTAVSTPPLADQVDRVWVLGGRAVFQKALKSEFCHRVYMTHIHSEHESDTFMPNFEQDFTLIKDPNIDDSLQEENGTKFQFCVYERIDPDP